MRKDGMKEDSYTISTLAKALKTCNDDFFVQKVFKMLDETEVDITSDEVLLNVVLDAFVRLKDMRRLNGVVRKVKDMRMVRAWGGPRGRERGAPTLCCELNGAV